MTILIKRSLTALPCYSRLFATYILLVLVWMHSRRECLGPSSSRGPPLFKHSHRYLFQRVDNETCRRKSCQVNSRHFYTLIGQIFQNIGTLKNSSMEVQMSKLAFNSSSNQSSLYGELNDASYRRRREEILTVFLSAQQKDSTEPTSLLLAPFTL